MGYALDSAPVRERVGAVAATADELRGVATHLRQTVYEVQWSGRSADLERHWVDEQETKLLREANELDLVATALRAHADWIDHERADLLRIEYTIEQWAHANAAPGLGDGRPHAGLITEYPLPLSPEWRVLLRRLRMLGAPL